MENLNIGGATAWPSHKANALHQSTQQYALSTYISPEDWAAIRIQTAFRGYLVLTLNLLIELFLLVQGFWRIVEQAILYETPKFALQQPLLGESYA